MSIAKATIGGMGRAKYPATLLCDFYKVNHKDQYPKGTQQVYSTWIPRGSRLNDVVHIVHFGVQAFIKEYLIDYFNEMFFNRPKEEVIYEYERFIRHTLFVDFPDTSHIAALHDLGYLPLLVKSLPEGTLVPLRVPSMTIESTHDDFFWVTNYIETITSNMIWQPMTSATIAFEYRKVLEEYAIETVGESSAVQFQGHDFSHRGMGGLDATKSSGAAHLLSFVGTDSCSAILYLEDFYNANIENELVGTSIPATEHSVTCANGMDEKAFLERLITKIYPKGFVSNVSDTWDFWNNIENVIPSLKKEIMDRNGRYVVRPDSGDPVEIICGIEIEDFTNHKYIESLEDCKEHFKGMLVDKVREETPHGELGDAETEGIFKYNGKYYNVEVNIDWDRYDKQYYHIDGHQIYKFEEIKPTVQQLGLIESLWNIFGGTITEKGYKLLDSHIGAIYGDSITIERTKEICRRLKVKGFASTNIVLGIGSFTYQYNTRDTFYFAMKATHAIVNGEEKMLHKDPKTDNGTKKSLKGRAVVLKVNGELTVQDNLTIEQQTSFENVDLLKPVFLNGELLIDETLHDIRLRLLSNL